MQHVPERLEFQIERLAFFSDAVIAIAITLLVFNLKLPAIGKDANWKNILDSANGNHLVNAFIALLICFLTVGNLWMKHHWLFQYVIDYNPLLVRVNLYFVLTITFLPFSTSFALDDNPVFMRFFVYFDNFGLCFLAYYWLLTVVFSPKFHFSSLNDPELVRRLKLKALISCGFFFGIALVFFFKPTERTLWIALIIYGLGMFGARFMDRRRKIGPAPLEPAR